MLLSSKYRPPTNRLFPGERRKLIIFFCFIYGITFLIWYHSRLLYRSLYPLLRWLPTAFFTLVSISLFDRTLQRDPRLFEKPQPLFVHCCISFYLLGHLDKLVWVLAITKYWRPIVGYTQSLSLESLGIHKRVLLCYNPDTGNLLFEARYHLQLRLFQLEIIFSKNSRTYPTISSLYDSRWDTN